MKNIVDYNILSVVECGDWYTQDSKRPAIHLTEDGPFIPARLPSYSNSEERGSQDPLFANWVINIKDATTSAVPLLPIG